MKRLVVVFDVSGFTDEEVASLEFAAVVQGEAEAGEYAHPDAPVGSLVVTDPIGIESLDRLVEEDEDEVFEDEKPDGRRRLVRESGRTWPTNDELRAEGRDPDTGVLRDPPATGHYNPTTGELELLDDGEES